ncbi:MobV family relaxase, partial [Vreelandella rituensis]|uniref:MobV family relaxase n=1 Tax=Vreelandella rituensis TaxID=2282306 RepID=UPI0039EE671F
MAYCIMRFQKLKAASWGSLAGSLAHTMRSRYTPNAVPELIKDNEVLLGPESPKEVIDLVRERWPEKYRKDAVGCIEYFIGASPEWFKKHGGDGDQERYFQGAIDWLKREYGEENVVSVVQHNDETSPHLAAYVVPIDEYGNLNAKKWTGGRPACARMQTRFQEFAGEPVGLERGVRGSKAEHLTIQRFYEENKTLNEKRREIKYDVIDIEAREAEIEEDSAEIRITKKMLKDRELELSRYSY